MAHKLLLVTCPFCKNKFNTYDHNKIFCNDSCKLYFLRDKKNFEEDKFSHKTHLTRKCEYCENYIPKEREAYLRGDVKKTIVNNNAKYCSFACYEVSRRNEELKKKQVVYQKFCTECGCAFESKSKIMTICSHDCREKRQIKKTRERMMEKEAAPRRKGKSLYELNRIAEKKRLSAEWKSLTKGRLSR